MRSLEWTRRGRVALPVFAEGAWESRTASRRNRLAQLARRPPCAQEAAFLGLPSLRTFSSNRSRVFDVGDLGYHHFCHLLNLFFQIPLSSLPSKLLTFSPVKPPLRPLLDIFGVLQILKLKIFFTPLNTSSLNPLACIFTRSVWGYIYVANIWSPKVQVLFEIQIITEQFHCTKFALNP